jgi:hypothetical protein
MHCGETKLSAFVPASILALVRSNIFPPCKITIKSEGVMSQFDAEEHTHRGSLKMNWILAQPNASNLIPSSVAVNGEDRYHWSEDSY